MRKPSSGGRLCLSMRKNDEIILSNGWRLIADSRLFGEPQLTLFGTNNGGLTFSIRFDREGSFNFCDVGIAWRLKNGSWHVVFLAPPEIEIKRLTPIRKEPTLCRQ